MARMPKMMKYTGKMKRAEKPKDKKRARKARTKKQG
jgi:hypothetical protein